MELANADKTQYTYNFWPTVDSYRLPGTTVLQNSKVDERKTSSCSWVGGTDINGIFGVTGMQLKTPGQNLSANKGWFMFDNEIVCLGSGITSTDNKVVEAIVENRKINSSGSNSLLVNGVQKSSSLGWSETMNGAEWAYLTGDSDDSSIGYYFPEGASVKGLGEARTGSWSEVTGAGSEIRYTKNFLTMLLDHGSNPSAKTYTYVLLPSVPSSDVSNYSSSPDITIPENSSDAMAVKENKLNIIGVNFVLLELII
ncbi:MAG TPA: polysaccharide lyase family 8 super-sandwich domain-containing protein [Pseudobacteroides sp.]|uniref:polysaccharide lyase family 8 super-sandwich domain-containing protein n=1 Tax=Pseudobacteroides sp. TaxID=1968840 RepID=UPI002F95729D